jgi:hypothetical protein
MRVLDIFLSATARETEMTLSEAAATDLREAAELLRGYVQSGRMGAHTEYYCGCKLNVCRAWYQAKPGDNW